MNSPSHISINWAHCKPQFDCLCKITSRIIICCKIILFFSFIWKIVSFLQRHIFNLRWYRWCINFQHVNSGNTFLYIFFLRSDKFWLESLQGIRLVTWPVRLKFLPWIFGWLTKLRIQLSDWSASKFIEEILSL